MSCLRRNGIVGAARAPSAPLIGIYENLHFLFSSPLYTVRIDESGQIWADNTTKAVLVVARTDIVSERTFCCRRLSETPLRGGVSITASADGVPPEDASEAGQSSIQMDEVVARPVARPVADVTVERSHSQLARP